MILDATAVIKALETIAAATGSNNAGPGLGGDASRNEVLSDPNAVAELLNLVQQGRTGSPAATNNLSRGVSGDGASTSPTQSMSTAVSQALSQEPAKKGGISGMFGDLASPENLASAAVAALSFIAAYKMSDSLPTALAAAAIAGGGVKLGSDYFLDGENLATTATHWVAGAGSVWAGLAAGGAATLAAAPFLGPAAPIAGLVAGVASCFGVNLLGWGVGKLFD